jgi:hypothetical protein
MGIEPPDRPSTKQIVDALVRRARSLGLAAGDLNVTVSDLLRADAAKRAEAGGDLNAELDLAEQDATNINNGGLESQLRFLVGEIGARQVRATVAELALPHFSPLRLVA